MALIEHRHKLSVMCLLDLEHVGDVIPLLAAVSVLGDRELSFTYNVFVRVTIGHLCSPPLIPIIQTTTS